MSALIDIKKVQDEAKAEVLKERETDAKKRIKAKMKEIADLETALANAKRELDDLVTAITEGN